MMNKNDFYKLIKDEFNKKFNVNDFIDIFRKETKNIDVNELTPKERYKIWKDIDKKIWNFNNIKFDKNVAKWADEKEKMCKQVLDKFVDDIHNEFELKAENFLDKLYDKLKLEEYEE